MRTFARSAVVALALSTLALACADANNQPPPRAASHPTPQTAVNDPSPQQPYDPITKDPRPRQPFNDPSPQSPALQPPVAQAPLENPEPQRPFYGPGTTAPDDRAQAKTERPLTDAEILGIAETANKGEVSMADVALKKATKPEVKHFAALMKQSHQKALDADRKLEQKTKITAAESDVSALLTSDTDRVLKDLRDRQGKDFDRAYIDAQVKAHKDVLTAIDNRMVPNVRNGEMKAMVTDMRRTVAEHLVKAEDVQKKVDSNVTSHDAKAKSLKPVEKR
jgi:putative membrane protein